jgi:predicted GTPase
MERTRVIIMGAAGRDFHNFNTFFRDKKEYEVVAFTATQIPGIADKVYPRVLAGDLYPRGIPIYSESLLDALIKEHHVDSVVFAYSDVPHEYVMHKASQVLAAGADFWLLGPDRTMLKSKVPVVSVCAVRTGSGKSQTSRKVVKVLREMGKRVVSIRHPMPYGDLADQAVERFADYSHLDLYNTTIEEREEYEPHIDLGAVIYAGVDYEKILHEAEKEADVIVWDGGNNDFSFYRPDLQIVVMDPLRPGHEMKYHPGETNVRMADVLVINKENNATPEAINEVKADIRKLNPKAIVIDADSAVYVDDPEAIKGKRVLVVEDGPTLTHGEMSYGAGYVAAKAWGAAEIVSPYPYAIGSIRSTYEKYAQTREVLPAMGYSDVQIKELEETINSMPVDLVVIGTPIDLRRVLTLKIPSVRVSYELEETSKPDLETILKERFGKVPDPTAATEPEGVLAGSAK